jgi:putative DNA primase/helicase
MTLGPTLGGAIKIDEDASVTQGLCIGEGLESTLAGRQIGYAPAWALGSAGAIRRFPVLSGIDAITLLRESDKTGANKCACNECARRWLAAGKECTLIEPELCGDLNDVLNKGRRP